MVGKQLVALMRVRRSLHGVAKVAARPYNPNSQTKLSAELKTLKKKTG